MRRFIWAVSIAFGVLFVGCKTSHIGENIRRTVGVGKTCFFRLSEE